VRGVDHLLRSQYSLQNETARVAGLVHEIQADNQERDEEISKLSALLDGIKARTSMSAGIWVSNMSVQGMKRLSGRVNCIYNSWQESEHQANIILSRTLSPHAATKKRYDAQGLCAEVCSCLLGSHVCVYNLSGHENRSCHGVLVSANPTLERNLSDTRAQLVRSITRLDLRGEV